mmetsp:Transcript_2354/g.7056  ORF Transcript_2354/g.7056 Transcript_2354/m.7056 type:complete len:319 (+) Transcript_2354:2211-3167(+)
MGAARMRRVPRGDRAAARTRARCPRPRLKMRKTSSRVFVSSTICRRRLKIERREAMGVSSSGSTKMRSLTKSNPTIFSRSPRKTGTRENPCSKMSRTTLKFNRVCAGNIYMSSSGVMTSETGFSFISSAPFMTFPDSVSSSPRRTCTFIYCSISFLVCTVPTSSSKSKSRPLAKGIATGARSIVNSFTSCTVEAPTRKACREQVACGKISPKITISPVEMKRPNSESNKFAAKIDKPEFTMTFPNNSVHKSLFPSSRTGRTLRAQVFSSSVPPPITISKPVLSRPNRPKVNPENSPDIITKKIITAYCNNWPSKPSLG